MQETQLSGPVAHASADGHTVHGVAIGEGDLTRGEHGLKKWPRDILEPAAESLAGQPFVYNAGDPSEHDGPGRQSVGEVVRAAYEPGVGVVYEATVEDERVAERLARGEYDVSIEGSGSDIDEDPETGAAILRGFEFTGIAAVEQGASPSNYTAPGAAGENPGIAALSATVTNDLDDAVAECKDSVLEDNPAMSEGEAIAICRSQTAAHDAATADETSTTGETTHMADHEDDEDETESTAADHGDERLAAIPMPDDAQLLYPTAERAEAAADRLGLDGTHSHDLDGEEWHMPGDSHEAFADRMEELAVDMGEHYDDEEQAAASVAADRIETRGAESPADHDTTTDMSDEPTDTEDAQTDDAEALLSRLDDKDERIEELEAKLSDQADEIESVKRSYAAALTDHTDTPLTEDDLVEGFSVAKLRERVEDIDADVAEATNPDVRSGGGDNGADADAALSADEREEKERLEANLAELPEEPETAYKRNLREKFEAELAAITGGDH